MARERDQTSLGQVVRRHRIEAGLTQQELSRKAGLSVRALRDLEQDRVAGPRAPSIRRLQAALGLSADKRGELLAVAGLADYTPPVPLRVGVLGPLSVHSGGEVQAPAGLPRTLLGLLTLHCGQVVSATRSSTCCGVRNRRVAAWL
jgi:DNA-binding XRE family transcriptional regulator